MENYKNLSLDDLENEIWIDAIGFDGIYNVSNLGRIKSLGRWVSNGKSERFVKERIRKQVLCKDNRLTCPFSSNNKSFSINVSAVIYFSFNTMDNYESSKHCIMHKNKIAHDNRLENLKLTTVSKSHSTNNKFGLINHLHLSNKKKSDACKLLKEKECKTCKKIKPINKFEYGRRTCFNCRYEQSKLKNSIIKESEAKDV